MNVAVTTVIDQAIRYERGLAELYNAYHRIYPEDSDLWWELSLSELSHASLLEAGRRLFDDDLETEAIDAEMEELIRSNDELEALCERISTGSIPREEALRIALDLENSENEKVLHRLFSVSGGEAGEVADKIRKEDLHHANRIRAHARELGLEIDASA